MLGPFLRQLDIANTLTLSGLTLSFMSVISAIQGHFSIAILLLVYAGMIDLFDGFVARKIERTPLQAEVGKQLDSLVDLCSFGFTPAIFAYCFGLRDPISITLLILYVGANALRLAYFNCIGLTQQGQQDYYTGLPVTYAALFIPVIFMLNFVVTATTMKFILMVLYGLLAIAMLSSFKMLKLRGLWYGFFGAGSLALTVVYSWAIVTGS